MTCQKRETSRSRFLERSRNDVESLHVRPIWHQAQIGDASGGYLFGDTPADGKPKFFTFATEVKDPRVKPAGQWNTLEMTARGKTLTLWVNGAVTCQFHDCGQEKGRVETPTILTGVPADGRSTVHCGDRDFTH